MLKKNFSRLSNEALATLASQTMMLVNDTGNTTLTGNQLFAPIDAAYKPFFALLNKDAYSGMGTLISGADKRRDNCYSGFCSIIKAMARFKAENEMQGQLATQLLPYLKKAGAMRSKTYAQQTSAVERLIADLSTKPNTIILTQLGILNLYTLLKDVNAIFKADYVKQVDSNSNIRQLGTATQLRKPLEEALKQFYTLAEAMKASVPWKDLYSDLSELVMRTKF